HRRRRRPGSAAHQASGSSAPMPVFSWARGCLLLPPAPTGDAWVLGSKQECIPVSLSSKLRTSPDRLEGDHEIDARNSKNGLTLAQAWVHDSPSEPLSHADQCYFPRASPI